MELLIFGGGDITKVRSTDSEIVKILGKLWLVVSSGRRRAIHQTVSSTQTTTALRRYTTYLQDMSCICVSNVLDEKLHIASDMSLMTEGHTSQVKLHSGCSNTAPTKYCAAVCFLKGQAVSIKTEKQVLLIKFPHNFCAQTAELSFLSAGSAQSTSHNISKL